MQLLEGILKFDGMLVSAHDQVDLDSTHILPDLALRHMAYDDKFRLAIWTLNKSAGE